MRLACAGLPVYFDKKATVVTPSPLLATVAAHQFSTSRLNHGLDAWPRPATYSMNAYLSACWQEARYNAADIPTLLSPSQERLLWQSIIEQQHPDLFDVNAIAGMARRSAQLIAEWHIPTEGDSWTEHQDAQQFQLWRKYFRRKCQDEGWITRSDLWQLLPKWIASGYCSPDPVVFVGFDVLTPALQDLKRSLADRAIMEPLPSWQPRQPLQ